MSSLNIAQQQCELIYLWQPRRGQHFFHTFEKSLGGRKWTSRNCCIICTWVGICVCVRTGPESVTCVRAVHVCGTDLCEVAGTVVSNGPIGQRLQEAQHWHGIRVLGGLDLLSLTADNRRTHFSGSLGKQHIRHQMTVTIRRNFPKRHGVPAYTGCLLTDSLIQGILFGQAIHCCSLSVQCP